MSDEHDRRNRYAAWGVTWLAYATYYLGRKGFSVAKKPMEAELGIDRGELGFIDSAFLLAYAIGQLGSGLLGDRIGARRLIAFGLLLSAVACAAFGSSTAAVAFGVAFFANGLAQSAGWPGTTRAMAEWTTRENRGRVMAIWATCYQVGGLVATAVAAKLLMLFGWRAAFFGVVPVLVVVALLVLWLLRPGTGAPDNAQTPVADAAHAAERAHAVAAALRSPTLYCYGASYFGIKLVRYSLLFWTPYYLGDALHYAPDTAAYASTAFEVGGIVGVIALGALSDRVRRFSRSALAAASLCALSIALLVYPNVGADVLPNVIALAVIGALLFGPDALISGAATQDIGGPHAAATAVGLVSAIGSAGAVAQGLVTAWLSERFGWTTAFYVFAAAAVVAAIALAPTLKVRTSVA